MIPLCGNRFVTTERVLHPGLFIRPLGHSLIPVFLAFDTNADVLRDMREDGTGWRFGRGASIICRVSRPRTPAQMEAHA
ncbi:hypothetical protein [Novosphingobium sp. 9U]|uniref:hypothetical protein n=1 Tax=Novosphingobium sp. 9U TaxID=2653158 RepID=UPI0012F1BBA4|nr:hypothetical protein [Novosphingobium sp. 9U]VWX48642.1 hypothetical protein NOVOSPHI9U_20033 [Novosphingobium sp. 9U]